MHQQSYDLACPNIISNLILVKRLLLPEKVSAVDGGGPISVCFERGGKVVATPDVDLNLMNPVNGVYDIDMDVNLVFKSTMYQEIGKSSESFYQVREFRVNHSSFRVNHSSFCALTCQQRTT